MDYYKAPLAEMTFLLEAFQYPERVQSLEAFEMFDIETLQALLETTSNIAQKELLPLNRVGDEEGIQTAGDLLLLVKERLDDDAGKGE